MELSKKYFNHRKWHEVPVPDTIFIETVMGCNLRCEMCLVPQLKLLMNRKTTTMMSLETFCRILGEIADKPRKLHLNIMGEPLLNKSISEFVALSKKAGHNVSLTTNGTLMNDVIARKLLIAGIDGVTFSIDGYEAKTYESIRIGANYEKVRSNVEQFSRLRNDLNKNATVQIHCILSDLTKSEITSMHNYWKKSVDIVNIIPLDDWGGRHVLPNRFGLRNWIDRASDNARYPCDLLWTTMSISAEGFVVYCTHDYKFQSNLPNVNEKPLRQIWEDNVSQERRKHVEETIDKDPCLHCDAWKTRQPYFRQFPLVQTVFNLMPPRYSLRAKKHIKSIIRRFT